MIIKKSKVFAVLLLSIFGVNFLKSQSYADEARDEATQEKKSENINDELFTRNSLTINPLLILITNGFNFEYEHALTKNKTVSFRPVIFNGTFPDLNNNPGISTESKITGFSLQGSYRYHWAGKGVKGGWIGPNVLYQSTTQEFTKILSGCNADVSGLFIGPEAGYRWLYQTKMSFAISGLFRFGDENSNISQNCQGAVSVKKVASGFGLGLDFGYWF